MNLFRSMVMGLAMFIGSSFLPGEAQPLCDPSGCANLQIKELFITEPGHVYVATDYVLGNLRCTPFVGYIILNRAHANFDQIFAALLSARLSGEPVKIRMNALATCNVKDVSF